MATVTGGDTSSLSLEIGHGESISQGDFVRIDDTPFIAQVTYLETDGGTYAADATFVGRFPDQAVPEGATVSLANPDIVMQALDIDDEGLHVGDLRGFDAPFHIDPDVAMRKQLGVFGRTGSGKSYTTAVLIEEFLSADKPVIVLDPHGEYASLKVDSDGDPAPYPVTHYAPTEYIPEADRDLDPDAISPGDLVSPGRATILDLVGLGDRRDDVVARLLSELFEARKRREIPPAKVVVEEAHAFAAKQKTPPRSVINSIAKEGRKFEFTLMVVSQRPSDVFHEVRSNLQSLLIHKLTDDTDVGKAVTVAEGLDTGWNAQIRQLETGQCIVAGDLVRSPLFVDVRSRYTMHHGGSDGGAFTPAEYALDPEAVADRQSELDEAVEEATAEQLREQIKRLARRQDVDVDTLTSSGNSDAPDPETSSPDATGLQSEIDRLETELDRACESLDDRGQRIQDLEDRLKDRESRIDELEAELADRRDPQVSQDYNGEAAPNEPSVTDNQSTETPSESSPPSDDDTIERTQADNDPRRRKEVLSRPHIQSALERYRSRLEDLSNAQRSLLQVFAKNGSISLDYAYSQVASSSGDPPSVDPLVRSGFVDALPDGTYVYNIRQQLDNAVGDTLRDGELDYIVDEIEKEI
jgi:hypothetical protein